MGSTLVCRRAIKSLTRRRSLNKSRRAVMKTLIHKSKFWVVGWKNLKDLGYWNTVDLLDFPGYLSVSCLSLEIL